MRERRRNLGRRIASGALAGLLAATSVMNSLGSITAYAATGKWNGTQKISYSHESLKDIEIAVDSGNESFGPGEDISLNVYIRNNTSGTLEDGALTWAKNEYLEDGYFVVPADNETAEDAVQKDEILMDEETTETAEETSEAVPEETTAVSEETTAAPAEETTEVPAEATTEAVEETSEAVPEETTAAPAEETTEVSAGATTEAVEETSEAVSEETTEAPAEETTEAPAEATTEAVEETSEAISEETTAAPVVENSDGEGDSIQKVTGITLKSGETFEVIFRGTLKDAEDIKNAAVKFQFTARDGDGNEKKEETSYRFMMGGAVMLPAEYENDGIVEAGEEGTLYVTTQIPYIEEKAEGPAVTGSKAEGAGGTGAGVAGGTGGIENAAPEEEPNAPEETEAEPTAPSEAETVPETAAPAESETPAPEEDALTPAETESDTEAAETPAPETEAVTEAAAETPAPETEAATEAAETPAPETEAATEAATEAPAPETEAAPAAPAEEEASDDQGETIAMASEAPRAFYMEFVRSTDPMISNVAIGTTETEGTADLMLPSGMTSITVLDPEDNDTAAPSEDEADTEPTEAPAENEAVTIPADNEVVTIPVENEAVTIPATTLPVEETLVYDLEEDAVKMAKNNVSYEFVTYGVKLEKVKAVYQQEMSDMNNIVTAVKFNVPEDAKPGYYYGTMAVKVKAGDKTYTANQGIRLYVEGDIVLTADTETGTVTVTGPSESFPAGGKLELEAKDVVTEEVEGLQDAIDKLASDEGVALDHIKAVSLKLLVDGEEAELLGDVKIEFKGFAKEVEKAVEESKAVEEDANEKKGIAGISTFSALKSGGKKIAKADTSETAQNDGATDEGEETSGTTVNIATYTFGEDGLVKAGAADENGVATIDANKMAPVYLTGETIDADVLKGYVDAITLKEIMSGTGNFDDNNAPGNDKDADNDLVRTFDVATYKYEASMAYINNRNQTSGTLYLQAVLPMDPTEARFYPEGMAWVSTGDNGYKITYYDSAQQPIATGENALPNYSFNVSANANDSTKGSKNSGNNYSYRSKVAYQVFEGYYVLDNNNTVVIPGSKELTVAIKVLASTNGTELRPTATAWVGGNTANSNGTGLCNNNIVDGNSLPAKNVIKVSAAPRYNIVVTNPEGTLDYKSNFNLQSGIDQSEAGDVETVIAGRMQSFGIGIQLRNNSASKGIMGIELPQGDIEFDLRVEETIPEGTQEQQKYDYLPVLWDIIGNYEATTARRGAAGRNMYWDYDESRYAGGTLPGNSGAGESACYNGGMWKFGSETEPGTTLEEVKNGSTVINGRIGKTYKIKVSGYDFDLDKFDMPIRVLGSSGANGLITANERYISVGLMQVIARAPAAVTNVTAVLLSVNVSGAKFNSLNGTSAEEYEYKDEKQIAYAGLTDNSVDRNTNLYPPGDISKLNSFTLKDKDNFYAFQGMMSDFWGYPDDSACFNGDDILIWGGLHLGRADYHITDFNVLQKFDSKVFKVQPAVVGGNDEGKKVATNCGEGQYHGLTDEEEPNMKVLYAYDPDYPQGWDSNVDGMMEYMNQVKEEDLVYADSLEDLGGNACVAVLIEVRDVKIQQMRYVLFGIPVHVEADPWEVEKGTTYCTLNTLRAWSTEYNNGKQDIGGFTWKNNNKEGWVSPLYALEPSKSGDDWCYTKREYDGIGRTAQKAVGTALNGQTMMILNYRAQVGLDTEPSTKDHFDIDKGERTAGFNIKEIRTVVNSPSSQNPSDSHFDPDRTTDLELNVKMDPKLHINSESFTMRGPINIGGTEVNIQDTVLKVGVPVEVEYPVGVDQNGEKIYRTIEVTLTYDESTGEAKIKIENAIVGTILPNIYFTAGIGDINSDEDDVVDSGHYAAEVTISGSEDHSDPYEERHNIASKEIIVSKLSQTALSKSVDKIRVEMNQPFTYTIRYANKSEGALNDIYLYDILPYGSDSLGTHVAEGANFKILKIEVELDTGNEDTNTAIYENKVEGDHSLIDTWSVDAFNTKFEAIASENETVKYGDKFHVVPNGLTHSYSWDDGRKLDAIGLYVSRLVGKTGINLRVTYKPTGNAGGDTYYNKAYAWYDPTKNGMSNNTTNPDPADGSEGTTEISIKSNMVFTEVVQRGVSGKVWYDKNKNGKYDVGERLIKGVKVSLLMKQKDGTYEQCKDVTGGDTLGPIVTKEDGEYSFSKLSAGDYIVVFDNNEEAADGYAKILDTYKGATDYQKADISVDDNNDGKALSETGISNYGSHKYMIWNNSNNPAVGYVEPEQMLTYDDVKVHLDLGLVRDPAKIKLKKVVANEAKLPNEDNGSKHIEDYKFIIKLQEVDKDKKTPIGSPITEVALGSGEESGWLYLDDFYYNDSDSRERYFKVIEVVPMEYDLTGEQGKYEANTVNNKPKTETGSVIGQVYTVVPGDTLTITLTNVPSHKDYFHHTASVTNVGKQGVFTDGTRINEYQENHGNDAASQNGTAAASLPVAEEIALVDPDNSASKARDVDVDDRFV